MLAIGSEAVVWTSHIADYFLQKCGTDDGRHTLRRPVRISRPFAGVSYTRIEGVIIDVTGI